MGFPCGNFQNETETWEVLVLLMGTIDRLEGKLEENVCGESFSFGDVELEVKVAKTKTKILHLYQHSKALHVGGVQWESGIPLQVGRSE